MLGGTADLDVPILRKPFDQETLAASLAEILKTTSTTTEETTDR